MRVVAGLIGAVLGTIIGVVIGLLAAIVTTHNDLFGIFFIGICTVPAGALPGSILGAVAGLRLLYVSGETKERRRIGPKQVLLVSTAVIGSAAIPMVVLVWIIRIGMTPPSDQSLLSNFDKHEATFNALIDMLETDGDWSQLMRTGQNQNIHRRSASLLLGLPRIVSCYERLACREAFDRKLSVMRSISITGSLALPYRVTQLKVTPTVSVRRRRR